MRESGTGSSQYALNTNIYRIVTHDSTDTVSTIDKVYDADGTEITDDTAKQLYNGAIVNKNSGTSSHGRRSMALTEARCSRVPLGN